MAMGCNCSAMEIITKVSIRLVGFMVKAGTLGKMGLLMMELLWKGVGRVLADGNQVKASSMFILVNTKTIRNQEKGNTHGIMGQYIKDILSTILSKYMIM